MREILSKETNRTPLRTESSPTYPDFSKNNSRNKQKVRKENNGSSKESNFHRGMSSSRWKARSNIYPSHASETDNGSRSIQAEAQRKKDSVCCYCCHTGRSHCSQLKLHLQLLIIGTVPCLLILIPFVLLLLLVIFSLLLLIIQKFAIVMFHANIMSVYMRTEYHSQHYCHQS